MVRLPKSKVSSLQNRLNRNPQFTDKTIQRPYTPTRVVEHEHASEEVPVFYVGQMDAATAYAMDHKGGVIIRFCDPGSADMTYRNAKAVLKIEREATFDTRSKRKAVEEDAEKIKAFLSGLDEVPHIHVHCKYGEQRSVGFVNGISAMSGPWVPFVHFFKVPNGVKSIRYSTANKGSGDLICQHLGYEVVDFMSDKFGKLTETPL